MSRSGACLRSRINHRGGWVERSLWSWIGVHSWTARGCDSLDNLFSVFLRFVNTRLTATWTLSRRILMLHHFVARYRAEIIAETKAMVAARECPRGLALDFEHGVPVFLTQLSDALVAETGGAAPSPRERFRYATTTVILAALAGRRQHQRQERPFSVPSLERPSLHRSRPLSCSARRRQC
jgi:hypothetical protein